MASLRVHFSDACSDVLVYLASLDEHQWRYSGQIVDAVAPSDANEPRMTVRNALTTLLEYGLVEVQKIDALVQWRIAPEGRGLVERTAEKGSGS